MPEDKARTEGGEDTGSPGPGDDDILEPLSEEDGAPDLREVAGHVQKAPPPEKEDARDAEAKDLSPGPPTVSLEKDDTPAPPAGDEEAPPEQEEGPETEAGEAPEAAAPSEDAAAGAAPPPQMVENLADDDLFVFLDYASEEDFVALRDGEGPRAAAPAKKGCLGKAVVLLLVLLLLGAGGFALWWFVLRDTGKPAATAPEEEEPTEEEILVRNTPERLRQRRASLRLETALKYGGTEASEEAVDSALGFLARTAGEDGRWDSKKHGSRENVDLAMTGLSLLAFAGAGQTAEVGDHRETVKKAVAFLISKQDPETGRIWEKGQGGYGVGYTHAICGMALAEVAALDRDEKTLEAARKAVDYAVNVHAYKDERTGERGGWRYNAGQKPDTSVTGWFVMQLKSAFEAGVDVPGEAMEGAVRFLERVRAKKKDEDGERLHLYGYDDPWEMNARRSAIGCLCRLYIDASPPELAGSAAWITEKRMPSWKKQDWYYWYYGMLLTFQVDRDRFLEWNEALRDLIVENQVQEGDLAGSWDPQGEFAKYGRLFSTTLATLCLEVYYRYAPVDRRTWEAVK